MLRLLALLPLLAGCAAAPSSVSNIGCSGSVRLRNQASVAVEQAYFSLTGPASWGRDLLAPALILPGGETPVVAQPGANAVRIVFTNGRAAEMPAMDVCSTSVLNIRSTSLLAER